MLWLPTKSGPVGQWWSEPCAVCLENYTDFCMLATGSLTGIQVQGWNPQIYSKTLCWFSGAWVSLGVGKYPASCEQSVWQFLYDKVTVSHIPQTWIQLRPLWYVLVNSPPVEELTDVRLKSGRESHRTPSIVSSGPFPVALSSAYRLVGPYALLRNFIWLVRSVGDLNSQLWFFVWFWIKSSKSWRF